MDRCLRRPARRAAWFLNVVLLVAAMAAAAGTTPTVGARQASPEASPAAATVFTVGGEVEITLTLTVADLQALGLPVETVDVAYRASGAEVRHSFTGIRLFSLLEAAGIAAEPAARNPLLTRYVLVTAGDGYRVVFSGGELDPTLGNAPILVAWEQDGRPLSTEQGPVRIAAPGDEQGDRYVFGVVRIELVDIGAA